MRINHVPLRDYLKEQGLPVPMRPSAKAYRKPMAQNREWYGRTEKECKHCGQLTDEGAVCKCGWKGPKRPYPFQVRDDLMAHYRKSGQKESYRTDDPMSKGLSECRLMV